MNSDAARMLRMLLVILALAVCAVAVTMWVAKWRREVEAYPLLDAAFYSDSDEARKLLDERDPVDRTGPDGLRPLHIAVFRQNADMLQLLLEGGVDPNMRATDGRAPLHVATMIGGLDIVRLLLEGGADVNAQDPPDSTPLAIALTSDWPDVVQLLREYGGVADWGPTGPTALATAADAGNMAIVEAALASGVGPNATEEEGASRPLYRAVGRGRLAAVRLLLEVGADTHDIESEGPPMVYTAVRQDDYAVLLLLLEHGADPNVPGPRGASALALARLTGKTEAADALVEYGAVEAWDQMEGGALFRAVYHNDIEGLTEALAAGADPNAQGPLALTPLRTAVKAGRTEAVRLLLENGAAPDTKGDQGRTVLHTAAEAGNVAVARLLLDHGADVNTEDITGDTPLALALGSEHEDMAELLEARGGEEYLLPADWYKTGLPARQVERLPTDGGLLEGLGEGATP